MNERIDEAAEEAARKAKCTRCRTVIMDDPSRSGLTLGRIYVPAVGFKDAFQLCGKCGLLLRELVYPVLENDTLYREHKAKLFEEHWS